MLHYLYSFFPSFFSPCYNLVNYWQFLILKNYCTNYTTFATDHIHSSPWSTLLCVPSENDPFKLYHSGSLALWLLIGFSGGKLLQERECRKKERPGNCPASSCLAVVSKVAHFSRATSSSRQPHFHSSSSHLVLVRPHLPLLLQACVHCKHTPLLLVAPFPHLYQVSSFQTPFS